MASADSRIATPQTKIEQALRPLLETRRQSESLLWRPLQKHGIELPRFVFLGPNGGGDPIHIGFFAAIHGDEPAGTHALVKLLEMLFRSPELAMGYDLFVYPICNPTGFCDGTRRSRSGKDLNREFWRNSCEPEIMLLEEEIRRHAFHGLVSLHADDSSDGIYGFVRGALLTRDLLQPALRAAETFLPRNLNSIIDGFPAKDGIVSECYDGILASPPELHPTPFEIILETPQAAAQEIQVSALLVAMQTVLAEYRRFLSFAANL